MMRDYGRNFRHIVMFFLFFILIGGVAGLGFGAYPVIYRVAPPQTESSAWRKRELSEFSSLSPGEKCWTEHYKACSLLHLEKLRPRSTISLARHNRITIFREFVCRYEHSKEHPNMKRVLALLFAIALSVSMSSFAFAQDNKSEDKSMDKMDKPMDKMDKKEDTKAKRHHKYHKKEKKDEMKKDEMKKDEPK